MSKKEKFIVAGVYSWVKEIMCCDNEIPCKKGDWVFHNLSLAQVVAAGRPVKNNGVTLDYGSYRWHLDNDELERIYPLTPETLRASFVFQDIEARFTDHDSWGYDEMLKHRFVLRRAWELALDKLSDLDYITAQWRRVHIYYRKMLARRVKNNG
ncbi:MAG: hypothetical protein V3U54_08630 [Thermodesulfobacteriota bacterium]